MSNDVFTLFSTVHILRDEYMDWLHQLNAVMIPEEGGPYDARLSKDTRHIWIFLQDEKWFNLTLAEFEDEPEALANICQFLGGEPISAIELAANDIEGSQILAVQFAALCAKRYPCVVYQSAGQALIPRQEVLELRDTGMGFDGLTWETAQTTRFDWNTRIIEEAKQRAQQNGSVSAEEEWQFERPEAQHKEHLEAS